MATDEGETPASSLYARLSSEERAERRADMMGRPWTDPRDFGMTPEQFGLSHAECPVLGGITRFDYCWERCPASEPDDRCPRRLMDSKWWWDVAGKVENPHMTARGGAEQPVTPSDSPAAPPTPTPPRSRRRDDRGGDRGDATEQDVFDLFGQ